MHIPVIVRSPVTSENPILLAYVMWDSVKRPGKKCGSMAYRSQERATKVAESLVASGRTGVHVVLDCCAGFAF